MEVLDTADRAVSFRPVPRAGVEESSFDGDRRDCSKRSLRSSLPRRRTCQWEQPHRIQATRTVDERCSRKSRKEGAGPCTYLSGRALH